MIQPKVNTFVQQYTAVKKPQELLDKLSETHKQSNHTIYKPWPKNNRVQQSDYIDTLQVFIIIH